MQCVIRACYVTFLVLMLVCGGSNANASSDNGSLSVGLGVSAVGILGESGNYVFHIDPVSGLTVFAEPSFAMIVPEIAGMISVDVGYNDVASGLGFDMEVSYARFTPIDSDNDKITYDNLSFFINVNWRSLLSNKSDDKINTGLYGSLGAGVFGYWDMAGMLNVYGTYHPAIGTINPARFASQINFDNYNGIAATIKIKGGIERLLEKNGILTLDIFGSYVFQANSFTDGNYRSKSVNLENNLNAGALFTNTMDVQVPNIGILGMEIKIRYLFSDVVY